MNHGETVLGWLVFLTAICDGIIWLFSFSLTTLTLLIYMPKIRFYNMIVVWFSWICIFTPLLVFYVKMNQSPDKYSIKKKCHYYKCRFYLAICGGSALFMIQIVLGATTLFYNYSLEDCNSHELGKYSRQDYNAYFSAYNLLPNKAKQYFVEYHTYEQWVHDNVSAQ